MKTWTTKLLLCVFSAALAAAQDLNWLGAGRFRNQRPAHPEVQKPAAIQQQRQSFNEPLTWRYPEPPAEEPPQYPAHFELKVPQAANSVTAICGENTIRVEAKKDLLGIGKPVLAADVTLGGCPVTGEDPTGELLIFESELHGCGSELTMMEDSFIYTFTLNYTPSPLGDSPVVRTRDVSVSVACHYQRKHEVSSDLIKPTWTPFNDAKTAEESLYFAIHLMTDNWEFARPSSQFILGDMMRFEVSVKQFQHVPLRLTVDICTATVVPNIDTVPRYAFLGNHGCLFDSQLTGSSSRFLPRTQDDRLRFEVEAFRFQQDNSGVIYITCSVRATPATTPIDATNKACSFSNGWIEASGNHHACTCCDTTCGSGSFLSQPGGEWEEETAVGPILVKEKLLK